MRPPAAADPPLVSGRLVALYATGGVLSALVTVAAVAFAPLWLALLAAWGAASLNLLAGMYALAATGRDPTSRMKEGASGILYRVLLLPYRLLQYAWITIRRAHAGEPAIQEIGGGLLLGGRALPWDKRLVEELGVGAVIDLCAELPEAPFVRSLVGPRYLAAPSLDGGAPADAVFDEAVKRAVAWTRLGQRVFVHCALGHGRSVLVAAATLVALGEEPDVDAAVRALREKRPTVNLHGPQRAALDRWAARRASGA